MINVNVPIDIDALIAFEGNLVPQIQALNLDYTEDFGIVNYLATLYREWFEENTSRGWIEAYRHWMNLENDAVGLLASATFTFDDANEAMLFKLAFGGK